MGYKLAGFDVLGYNEIDPRMGKIYDENHNPKYAYVEDIRTFKERTDLPAELYNLDVLDGSPPLLPVLVLGTERKGLGKAQGVQGGTSCAGA